MAFRFLFFFLLLLLFSVNKNTNNKERETGAPNDGPLIVRWSGPSAPPVSSSAPAHICLSLCGPIFAHCSPARVAWPDFFFLVLFFAFLETSKLEEKLQSPLLLPPPNSAYLSASSKCSGSASTH